MLTKKDIENLTEYQKHVFVTKEDMEGVNTKITKLQTTVDTIVKTVDIIVKDVKDLKEEKTITSHRVKKLENWVDKASPKLGLKFEH